MSNKRYFIQEHLQKSVFHGGVGNIDIERILLDQHFKPIVFPFHYDFSFKAKVGRYLYLLKVLITLPAGAIIFFQFPLYARMHRWLLQLIRIRKSIRVICLVADINGLKDGDEKVLAEEVAMLRQFRYFIVHGKQMEDWLKKQVPGAVTTKLLLFDFLATPSKAPRMKSADIAFAGNLSKSPFLEKLDDGASGLRFYVYGPDATEHMKRQRCIVFKGIFDPYTLPSVIEGSFGLLWDGKSTEGAGGSLGGYMHYISHHKLSLYILAGLPIIVYEDAGSAAFIEEEKIGFPVRSIREAGEKVRQLSEEDYQLMRNNMQPIASRIASGNYLIAALEELLKLIDEAE